MNIGNRLYELRKNKNISQEEAAEKLGVTRQTISKWETGESKPDFDKIVPICELYEISTEELLNGKKNKVKKMEQEIEVNDKKKQTAFVISISVFLYFIAVIWIIIVEPLQIMDENVMIGIFLLICAIATVILIFHFVSTPKKIEEENNAIKEEKKKIQKYDNLISLIFTVIYLGISFFTMAWHITWLLWIVYAIVIEIVHLLVEIKEDKHERK